jgi:hypothetical protein
VDDDNNGVIDDIHGANFAVDGTPTGDPLDDHNHGTHCAGTIAAVHNDIGVAGVMADATLVAVKFLSSGGGGSTDAAMRAIDYATKLKVNVMSNSWGGGGYSQSLFDVIKKASDQGIVFVVAAGNSSTNNDEGDFYPANYKIDSLISVAATNAQDELTSFSNYGAKSVHVAAPGHRILSTVIGNKYAVFSGTSMATPHVAGIVGFELVVVAIALSFFSSFFFCTLADTLVDLAELSLETVVTGWIRVDTWCNTSSVSNFSALGLPCAQLNIWFIQHSLSLHSTFGGTIPLGWMVSAKCSKSPGLKFDAETLPSPRTSVK